MREIRTYGSEGGEALRLPDPYHRCGLSRYEAPVCLSPGQAKTPDALRLSGLRTGYWASIGHGNHYGKAVTVLSTSYSVHRGTPRRR